MTPDRNIYEYVLVLIMLFYGLLSTQHYKRSFRTKLFSAAHMIRAVGSWPQSLGEAHKLPSNCLTTPKTLADVNIPRHGEPDTFSLPTFSSVLCMQNPSLLKLTSADVRRTASFMVDDQVSHSIL